MDGARKSRTNSAISLNGASIVNYNYRYADLNKCINCPTKSKTYDTLVSTSISIALQKVELIIH